MLELAGVGTSVVGAWMTGLPSTPPPSRGKRVLKGSRLTGTVAPLSPTSLSPAPTEIPTIAMTARTAIRTKTATARPGFLGGPEVRTARRVRAVPVSYSAKVGHSPSRYCLLKPVDSLTAEYDGKISATIIFT